MIQKPFLNRLQIHLTLRYSKRKLNTFFHLDFEIKTILPQEKIGGFKSSPLVPIHKGMSLNDVPGNESGKGKQIPNLQREDLLFHEIGNEIKITPAQDA